MSPNSNYSGRLNRYNRAVLILLSECRPYIFLTNEKSIYWDALEQAIMSAYFPTFNQSG